MVRSLDVLLSWSGPKVKEREEIQTFEKPESETQMTVW